VRTLILITLLHFSDYHSQAIPFYTEGNPQIGGIARATSYMARMKRRGAMIFGGGDMFNKGTPAWSDRYRCTEWPWFNGIVDAMALGNHDADYGYAELERCMESVQFPVLSANTAGFRPYKVVHDPETNIRIGAFAVAGTDFDALIEAPELRFGDPIAAAREAVRALREDEKVHAVVMIGHQSREADFALARAVPGIDLIFGSHSHRSQELMKIPETETWFMAAAPYLGSISRVQLEFDSAKLLRMTGRLVPVDEQMAADPATALQVNAMYSDLRRDPDYKHLFEPIATLRDAIPVAEIGKRAVDIMREAAGADVAISTASSFRRALPSGRIEVDTLNASMPYDNEIVVVELPADKARALLAHDNSAFVSGEVRGDTVRVATTDYVAFIAPGYRQFFEGVDVKRTGIRVRDEVRKSLSMKL
jgi:5'-nucleotidase / UDP-sugar diphosphatase